MVSPLAALTKLMATKKFQKSAKLLNSFTKQMNDPVTQDSIQRGTTFLQQFTTLNIALEPFNLLLTQIKASQAQASAEALTETLKIVKSDGMQSGANALGEALSYFIKEGIVENLRTLSEVLSAINSIEGDTLQQIFGFFVKFNEIIDKYNLSPLQQIIGFWEGVPALIAGLKDATDWFKDLFNGVEDSVDAFGENVVAKFEKHFDAEKFNETVIQPMIDEFKKIGDKIKEKMIDPMVEDFTTAGESIKDNLITPITDFTSGFAEEVQENMIAPIKEKQEALAKSFETTVQNTATAMEDAFMGILYKIDDKLEKIGIDLIVDESGSGGTSTESETYDESYNPDRAGGNAQL